MTDPLDLAICTACGVQHPTATPPPSCKICDDPRQYIPPSGQSWKTLRTLQSDHKNIFTPDPQTPDLIAIYTSPKFAIGQRALLCRTPSGKNILWDCISYIDNETVTKINELGGLHAIVISHPHYFSTNLYWAELFKCPVFISVEDKEWIMIEDHSLSRHVLWEGSEVTPVSEEEGVKAIKTGGHFPGSSVLWWKEKKKLLVADTIAVVPSGVYHVDRLPGTISFTFMWSYPNMIPLPPDEVLKIWQALKHADFDDAHGAFTTTDLRGNAKQRVLESAQIFVKAMGYATHPILLETSN